ncbi:hypothetical protein [Kingella potus]|uniref:hypothetical protein n=1 Tax=Kingella potus TaxID=265175 RepID=UPI001FD5370B|nr:hypothetical protein [Kingella potus]UOP01187.1 hypothetical protein LVJ84_02435 [Kingella potus]
MDGIGNIRPSEKRIAVFRRPLPFVPSPACGIGRGLCCSARARAPLGGTFYLRGSGRLNR